ncbi:N-acetyltransferase family protein [Streptomyces sp. NPDC003327]
MTIRDAVPEDAEALAAVHVRSWQAAYRELLPPAYLEALDVEERAARWRARLEAADGPTVLLATGSGGRPVGFAAVRPWPDEEFGPATTAELAALYTLPSVWGTGVGRRLTEAVVERVAASGFHSVALWVLAGNERARRFYEGAGWRADGTVVQEETGGVVLDELRYRRDLFG